MDLIESHDGLKEYLLRKENVEAAKAYADAKREERGVDEELVEEI